MKGRIAHMGPPMPGSVCGEEMWDATPDSNVVVEYIMDAQGRGVKKLKPLLIESEPDGEYIHHIHGGDNLPSVPGDSFMQRREITIDSYSETVSSESSSEGGTLTAEAENTMSGVEDHIEDGSCVKENNVVEVEASLHWMAASLQGAAEGYMSLASCIHRLEPYEMPQVIAQMPPPPMDVPMPIGKALAIDGEDEVVNHLLHGEYELTNASWSKLQKKYSLSGNKIYSALGGKGGPRGSQYQQKKRQARKLDTTTTYTSSETD